MRTDKKEGIGSIRGVRLALFLPLCAALLLGARNARAAAWYVAGVGSDSNPGTTAAKPFKTIQQGVSHAAPGDTVSVADGTYTGAGNRSIDFGGKDLAVQSASGNPASCILDCQQSGCAFILKSGETAKSSIAGFTIKNGTGYNDAGGTYGGGIYIYGAAPIVTNCVLSGNSVSSVGGGIYGGTAVNCTFTGNSATGQYSAGGGMAQGVATNCAFTHNSAANGDGGGMFYSTAINCSFTGNSASSGGGMSQGSGINCAFTSNTAVEGGGTYEGTAANCAFTSNEAANSGGAMYGGSATNCAFTTNTASGFGGGMAGGAATNCTFTGNNTIHYAGGGMDGGSATNCIFTNNSAPGAFSDGGGMEGGTATNCVFTGNFCNEGGATSGTSLYFCTVVNNSAATKGGGVYLYNSTVVNCIIWGNTVGGNASDVYYDTTFTSTITYSNVRGGFPGASNLNYNPLFVNAATGNMHLSATSPCLNKGTMTVPSGFTFPATDLDGGNRMVNNKADIGAYEFGGSAVSGSLVFSGIAPSAPAQSVTFQFRPVDGGAAIAAVYDATSDGGFYLNGIPNGSYNLWIKSPTYLAAVVPITLSGGAVSGLTAALQPGDANNDNSVDSTDFGILIGAYGGSASVPGSGYDPTADFNGDGVVDSTDFGLLIGNFNTVGAP